MGILTCDILHQEAKEQRINNEQEQYDMALYACAF